MAKAPSSGVTVTIDDSAGTPRIVTSFVITMGALKITNQSVVSTAMGDSWVQKLATGMQSGNPFTLAGFVDTTANTGTYATMIPASGDAVPGFTRTFSVLVGGKTWSGECIITDGSITAEVGLAKFVGTFDPTGTVTIS